VTLDERVDRLESDVAIRELVSRYCVTMDDRDLTAAPLLFTPDARVFSRDGVMDARGLDAILDLYRARFAALGPSLHVTHDHLVTFESADAARGLVSSHAEVWRNEKAQIAALRYLDQYRRLDGQWRFAERELLFFYYLEPQDYAEVLGKRHRVLTYDKPQPADFGGGGP
jgi:ketosteroid isomerase-like protein